MSDSVDQGLESFMKKFVAAGATAVTTYVTISGEPVATMPEYFLGSTLFTILGGSKRAVTLETSLLQLYQWAVESGTLKERSPKTDRWKLDMVFYDGNGTSPHQQQPWALVELK